MVSTALAAYQRVKNSAPILQNSLTFAETVAKRGIDVSIPTIKKIDEYAHIDQRSVALLDAIENRTAQAKDSITKVRTAASQPLDTIIDALDTYLPIGGEDVKAKEEEEKAKSKTAVAKIGYIGNYIALAGHAKLRELQLRGPVHKAIAHQAFELVSYSAAVLHLDTLGDTAAARVADAQHALFANAANAATNVQAFVERHPNLLAIEKAFEPYALGTKSVVERTVIQLIASVAASVDLANHFFAGTYADFSVIAQNAAKYSVETVDQIRKNHPQFEAAAQSLLESTRNSLSGVMNTIRSLSSLSSEKLSESFDKIYQLINQMNQTLSKFRVQLVEAAHSTIYPVQPPIEASPSAPEAEDAEHKEKGEHHEQHAESSSSHHHGHKGKKKRN